MSASKLEEITENNTYHIVNESPSLGDIIAWVPMVDKFQKEKQCLINFYTPYAELFRENYVNINFLPYNQQPIESKNLIRLGAYDIAGKKWSEFNLQELAAVILGIKYEPTVPRIVKPKNLKNNFSKKYVCIATQSSAQFKYWNNPNGWNKTIDYLKSLGYDVVCIDKYPVFGVEGSMNVIPNNCIDRTGDLPFSERINDLVHCDFFIGLTSGLSWLAWGLGKPVIFISGISLPQTDFHTPYRVTNTDPNICHGCASQSDFIFDKNNWLFCPKHKNFECTREISFEMVKEKIDLLMVRESFDHDFSLINVGISFLKYPRIEIKDEKYPKYLVQLYTFYNDEWIIFYENADFTPFQWYSCWVTNRQKWRFKVYAFEGDSLKLVSQKTYDEAGKNIGFVFDSEGYKYDRIYLQKAIEFGEKNKCNIFIKSKYHKRLKDEFKNFKNIFSLDENIPDLYSCFEITRHEIESKRQNWFYTNKLWIERGRSNITTDHQENWTEYPQEKVFEDIINYE